MNEKELIVCAGLDYPEIFGFWEMPELAFASLISFLFILIQETLLGISLSLLILYILPKWRNHQVRGYYEHIFWKIGLVKRKGFEYFPPSAATYFDF